MATSSKEWLLRTKARDIAGPFTLRELVLKLKEKEISPEDEIAPHAGSWISASTLQSRDVEEVTLTSTRVTDTDTRKIDDTHDPVENTENSKPLVPPTPLFPNPKQLDKKSENTKAKLAPFFTGVLLSFFLVALYVYVLPKHANRKAETITLSEDAHNQDQLLVKHVYEMINRGERKLALRELSELHEKQNGKGDLSYLIPYSALLITENESQTRARKFLETILANNPTPELKAKAHMWLGIIDLMNGEEGFGEDHFLEALQLNTKDTMVQFNLGRAYLKQENYQKALDYLQLAELEMPELFLIHIYKGRAKELLNLSDEARTSFQTAIQCSEDRWLSYIYYAFFLFKNHEFNEARLVLKKMITKDPSYEKYSPVPFGFYQEPINYAEYFELYNQIMEKAPAEDRELGKLYLSYISDPQGAAAKRILGMSVSGNLFSKVIALKVASEKQLGATELKTILDRLPANLNDFGYYAYVIRADVKQELGQMTEAQQDYRRALLIEPKSAISHFYLANLLKKLQKEEDARTEIESLLTYHPNYIPALKVR